MISISVHVQTLSEFYSTSQWKSILSFYKCHHLLKNKKTQKFTLACFHLHEVLAQVQLIDNNKNHRVIAKVGQRVMGRDEGRLQRDTRKHYLRKILYILIGVVVIWVYIFVKTHWNILWEKNLCISLHYENYISMKLIYLRNTHSGQGIWSPDTEANAIQS